MRELEFLPDWYPQLITRRRQLRIQMWLTFAALTTFLLWTLLSIRNVHLAQASLSSIRGQVTQSAKEVARMAELEKLQQQGQEQSRLFTSLGVGIDSTKLLDLIESLLPADTGLTQLSVETEDIGQNAVVGLLARASGQANTPADRRVKVRLQGKSRSEEECSMFIDRLNHVPFLSNVLLREVNDSKQNDVTMREFKVEFQITVSASEVN